jgi:CRP-like cAMP-binding protein
LSGADLALLAPNLERIDLPLRYRMGMAGVPLTALYFIETGIASVTIALRHDTPLEVGIVGWEGAVNLALVLGSDRSPTDGFMQVAGTGQRIAAADLALAIDQSATLSTALLRGAHVFMVQNATTVLANARATLQERLARWLLMSRDRVDDDTIALTHEFLAVMLGVHRPGVTVALRDFVSRGLVEGSRGRITILDRAALELAANGFYGTAEAEGRRLFGR